MQIALTKKLADALGVKPPSADETINPLFTWTANWTTVWENRRAEDLLVLVNNATRFTVAIYQVKRKDLKNVEQMMKTAIFNTLLAMGFNPELVEAYLNMAGEVEFAQNRNRQTASWVTRAGLECSFDVANEYNGIAKMFNDTVGTAINFSVVRHGKSSKDWFYPYEKMGEALSELTRKPAYKQCAFELLVTLDVHVYKVKRRIMVPANMDFWRLHKLLQKAFGWKGSHLYEFAIFAHRRSAPILRLVPFEEDLGFDDTAELMDGQSLADFFPEHKKIIYTYDFGDSWEHEIELVRVVEEYDQELPYLLEASGRTPPEDVGGIPGFMQFYEVISSPHHPEHEFFKDWAVSWSKELNEWESTPRVIHI